MNETITKTYYTIGDVAKIIDEAPSLIRFWEKEFVQLKPLKSTKGTRKYTDKEIELIKYIHYLVKTKGYTLDGAKDALRNDSKTTHKSAAIAKLTDLRDFLFNLKQKL